VLDHPAVSAESVGTLGAAPGDPGDDVAAAQKRCRGAQELRSPA
jgi:hypothetical protein